MRHFVRVWVEDVLLLSRPSPLRQFTNQQRNQTNQASPGDLARFILRDEQFSGYRMAESTNRRVEYSTLRGVASDRADCLRTPQAVKSLAPWSVRAQLMVTQLLSMAV